MDIADYKRLIYIDKDALDDALISQPMLYLGVADEFAHAVSRRDAAKEEIASVHAQVYLEERSELEKPTEALIASRVEVSKKYRIAVRKFLVAKEEAEQWLALRDSFQQRGYVLKDLASLYIAGYCSQNSVCGKDSQSVMDAGYRKNRDTIARSRQSGDYGKKRGTERRRL